VKKIRKQKKQSHITLTQKRFAKALSIEDAYSNSDFCG